MLTNVRELGAALQRRRVELDLSQAQLCKRAGVARSWLSRLEIARHQRVIDSFETHLRRLQPNNTSTPSP